MYDLLLEICCYSAENAVRAEGSGAGRIELCRDPASEGLTPTYNEILRARAALHIPLFVMIRPHAKHFGYTMDEFRLMQRDIAFCRDAGCDGVVFGLLGEDHTVDVIRNAQLVELARPMQCTFHRAFDQVNNPHSAMEQVIACGFSRILTAGCPGNAEDGTEALRAYITQSAERITIMPGGGITERNIAAVMRETGAREFHSSARNMEHSLDTNNVDPERVQAMKHALFQYGKEYGTL